MDALLALDLGQKTGWCLRHPDGHYVGGTADFSGQAERIGLRYYYFRRFLIRRELELAPGHEPLAAVCYEKVQFVPKMGGLKAAQAWAGFEAILTSWCEYKDIPYIGVPVGTLKKDFTGRGNASKEEMLDHARALGWKPVDDNHADAIALMSYYEVNHENRPRRVPGHEKASIPADLALEA